MNAKQICGVIVALCVAAVFSSQGHRSLETAKESPSRWWTCAIRSQILCGPDRFVSLFERT